MPVVRVQLVDPSAYSTPYDYALGAALVRAGASVELVTSRFVHGPTPSADGIDVIEHFYGRATRDGRSPQARRALKLAEHVPGMVGYRRRAAQADVRHYQWLPLEPIDTLLLPPQRPRVMTMHNVRRRGDGRAAARVTRRLSRQMDALVAKSPGTFASRARGLVDATALALKAIDTKNVEGLSDAGGAIDEACENCHLTFWYPNEKKK